MLKIYCKDCGSPSGYTLEKPKFCQGCGKPLGGQSSSLGRQKNNAKILAKRKPVEEESEYDEEEEYAPIPSLDSLDVEISARGPATHTFKELSEGASSEYDTPMLLPRDTRSKKEIFEEYQREAGNKNPDRDLARSQQISSQNTPSEKPRKKRGRPKKVNEKKGKKK